MNFNVQHIKDGDDYIVFFKIVENQHVKSTAERGNIFFGLLSNYRKMEQDEGKRAVGDQSEASLTHKVNEHIVYEDECYEIHGKTAGYNVRINNNQCAFCFYALGIKEFDKQSNNKYIHKIPYSSLESICRDKGGIENCSILIFTSKLVHKIYNELSRRNFKYAGQAVEYDDFDYIPKYDINRCEYSIECGFHKEKRFSYQHEFRIVAINNTNNPIKDLYININKDDFKVIELKKNSDFYSCVEVNAHKISEKEVLVNFCFEHSLRAVKANETEI